MQALTYLLWLRTPVLATQTTSGEPNSATGSPYLPGSLIRGAVLASAVAGGVVAEDDTPAQRAFFGAEMRFLNAYPALVTRAEGAVQGFERLLPAPRSLRKDKAKSASQRVYDFAIDRADLERASRAFGDDEPWFAHRRLSADERLAHFQPRTQLAAHNASDDRNRKQAGVSQVFRYQALAAGQYLAGVILGPDAQLDWLAQRLRTGDEWLLGGSRTAGYGLAVVDAVVLAEWSEYEPAPPAGDGRLVITLLSDAIIRDGAGAFGSSLDAALGAVAESVFIQSKIVGGFNRHWGLPYPQASALAAGSVFVYPPDSVDAGRLSRLIREGVGERRLDGYGRIAAHWQSATTYEAVESSDELVKSGHAGAAALPLTGESARLAARLVENRIRAQLETALTRQVVHTTFPGSLPGSLPAPAQLARVRLAARQALAGRSLAPLQQHLNGLYEQVGPPDARVRGKAKLGARQLEASRLRRPEASSDETFIRWLDACSVLEDETAAGRLFDVKLADPVEIGGQPIVLPEERRRALRIEFTARLVEAVMKQATQLAKTLLERQRDVARRAP